MRIDRLLEGYLQRRRAAGDDGKTLLVGLSGEAAVFALAAGLRGEVDHPRFLALARYLIHNRFGCDGYALLLPALLAGEEVYVIERHCAGDAALWVVCADGRRQPSAHGGLSIGDPLVAETGLPGIVRRDLDRLYEILQRPPPVAPQR